MGTWKPQVGTEHPLSLFVFKIGTFTEPGGQQLGLMADRQAPGIVLFPRDSIWLILSPLDFSHTVGDLNLGPQAYLEGAFPMDPQSFLFSNREARTQGLEVVRAVRVTWCLERTVGTSRALCAFRK